MGTLIMSILAGLIAIFFIVWCCFVDPSLKKKRLEKEKADLIKRIKEE